MKVGDYVKVKVTGNIETIENVDCIVGYGRYGLYGVQEVWIETERGVYRNNELEEPTDQEVYQKLEAYKTKPLT